MIRIEVALSLSLFALALGAWVGWVIAYSRGFRDAQKTWGKRW